jgi:hypothetical protein
LCSDFYRFDRVRLNSAPWFFHPFRSKNQLYNGLNVRLNERHPGEAGVQPGFRLAPE